MASKPNSKPARTKHNGPPVRLVKTWLPADLVRRVDGVILNSNGAYADRSEFFVEALTDRLGEEETANDRIESEAPGRSHLELQAGNGEPVDTEVENAELGDWLSLKVDPMTLPAAEGPAFNFGLHNRDLPSLWAFDWLSRLVAEANDPITWAQLEEELLPRAWAMGRILRRRDLSSDRSLKLAAGFPTNINKREATERRFLSHFVATVTGRGNAGPLFVFNMIGIDNEGAKLAPSPEGLELFRSLIEAGIAEGPPFPVAAWRTFANHLQAHATEELVSWIRVLSLLRDVPTRDDLVAACDWWSGSAAETNAMSYIARGREWGLVEEKIAEGRYRLTGVGEEETVRLSNSSTEEESR